MAEEKAAVEVKQEGDFKIKTPKRKAKNLGESNDSPVKVDFTKPEAQGEVIPDVAKIDLTKTEEDAVQTPKTDVGNAPVEEQKDSPDSEKLAEEVRPTEEKVESPIQEIIEEVTEEPVKQADNVVVDEVSPQYQLPENVDKLVKFME